MKALSNIKSRFSLIRTALTHRFIYADIVRRAKDYGVCYDDVIADIHPLEFARLLVTEVFPESCPDWSALDADSSRFTPSDLPQHFNSEPSVARFLGELAFLRSPENVIELGCFVGWTTAHLAKSLCSKAAGTIYAVDPSRKCLDVMLENLKRGGLDARVRPIHGFSEDAEVLAALPDKAGIIFIDTGHSYPQTLREIELYAPRLAAGGFIVLHDSMSAPGVRKSLLEVKGFRKMTFGTERGNGLTVLSKL
jgi:predicted O-methyltransferase YrrM